MSNANFVERTCCPTCGSNRLREVYRCRYLEPPIWQFLNFYYAQAKGLASLLEGAEFRLDECLECSLVFQRHVGTPRLLGVLYDEWLNSAYQSDQDRVMREALAAPRRSRDGHEIFAVSSTLGKAPSDLSVLDFGMGWAFWCRVALSLGCRTYGFDLSEKRREYGAQHGVQVVSYGEISRLSVDFINTEQVFEHLSQPYEDFRVLAHALKPNGILKVAVPEGRDIRRRLARADWFAPKYSRCSLNPVHPLEHVNCHSLRSLTIMAGRAGLVRVPIPLRSYFSFVRQRGAMPRSPLAFAKSVMRPAYHRFSPNNLYVWFQRPAAAG